MNATATSLARLAAIAIVVLLAAVLGLVAGNWIQRADSDLSAGAGGAALPHVGGLDGAHFAAVGGALAGAPSYADPHRRIMEAAESAVGASNAYEQYQRIEHAAAADDAVDPADAYEQYQRIEHNGDADAFTQTWGNLDEGDARAGGDDDAAPAPRMPTAPTPR